MDADLDAQRKLLYPYLKRAEEIEQHQPKIAYYLRLHAADLVGFTRVFSKVVKNHPNTLDLFGKPHLTYLTCRL